MVWSPNALFKFNVLYPSISALSSVTSIPIFIDFFLLTLFRMCCLCIELLHLQLFHFDILVIL